jgi:hypothetical protein
VLNIRIDKSYMVPVQFDPSHMDSLFLGNNGLIKRFNHALRSIVACYQSGDKFIALHLPKDVSLDKVVAIKMRIENFMLMLDDVSYLSDLPADISIVPAYLEPFRFAYDNTKEVTIAEEGGMIMVTLPDHKVPAPVIGKTHLPMETTHGRWFMPKGLQHPFCFQEDKNVKSVRIEEFLFRDSSLFCPHALKVYSTALDAITLLRTSGDHTTAMIKGVEQPVKPLIAHESMTVHQLLDCEEKKILVGFGNTHGVFSIEDEEDWIDFKQGFNINISDESFTLYAPTWMAHELIGKPMNTRLDRVSVLASLPVSAAEFLKRNCAGINAAGLKSLEKVNRKMLAGNYLLGLEKSEDELFLHHHTDWQEYYLKVTPGQSFSVIAQAVFSTDGFLKTKVVPTLKRYIQQNNKDQLISKVGGQIVCLNRPDPIDVYRASLSLEAIKDDQDFAWNLYKTTGDSESDPVYLHGMSNEQHVIFEGTLHNSGTNVKASEIHTLDYSVGDDGKAIVNQIAALKGLQVYLPEFSKHPDVSGFQPQDEYRNVHQVLSIFSSAHIEKDQVRVDLKVRYHNDIRSFSYGFVDVASVQNRYLKAAAEAMAIRHVLIEHYSDKRTVLKGSQSLRLDLSSRMLYDMLKGQHLIPGELWPSVRYIKTRSFNGRFTFDSEPPSQLSEISRLIDLNQPMEILEFDESLKMCTGNYHLTYHAVERSDQRMYNEKWHTGWGFIAAQMLRSFSHQSEFEKMDVKDNHHSHVYINENNWNFALKQGDHRLVKTVATLFEGLGPDQTHHNSTPRENRMGPHTQDYKNSVNM